MTSDDVLVDGTPVALDLDPSALSVGPMDPVNPMGRAYRLGSVASALAFDASTYGLSWLPLPVPQTFNESPL